MKIGIIREGKTPPDKRVPFSPNQLATLQARFGENLEILVESSPIRCFSDEEYRQAGLHVSDSLSDCDVLFGVKEVPIEQLIPEKSYFFFSHTIKKQPYNRNLLRAILEKNIRLLDYEVLTDDEGKRLVAFGRWAGIVGAYNALWTYGKKTDLFQINRAHECRDLPELKTQLPGIDLPPVRIVLTGKGRVGKGAKEILDSMQIREVPIASFLQDYFEEPVYVHLDVEDYNQRKTDGGFEKSEFYAHPDRYESTFSKFSEVAEILIGAVFWDPKAPQLFQLNEIASPDFSISVIADITCDIEGYIPSTLRPSTIEDPVYDIDRESGTAIPPFSKQNSISVMAIDNLPCELPREASQDFGRQLSEYVIPALMQGGQDPILERATIAREGDLTLEFSHLEDYVRGDD